MSSRTTFGQEASVEQPDEHIGGEGGFGHPKPELRPSVEQEVQATVDYADERALDGRLFGQTLAAEERMRAREWEIERTRMRWDRGQDVDREARCREVVADTSVNRRTRFLERAASVDPWADPARPDAREQLSRAELAAVNREAVRIARELRGFSTAAVSRLLAKRVVDGTDIQSAVMATVEELRTSPGQVIPIAAVGAVSRREVDIQGQVTVLWEPSHPSINQVGLLEDETGRIKFTAWKKSRVAMVSEGQQVRFRNVVKNWYRGQVSVALTGLSRVVFPDQLS